MHTLPMNGPAPEVLEQLRAWGAAAAMPQVREFYLQRTRAEAAPSTVLHDLPYGPHPRHRLDLYLPSSAGPHPVLLFLHGGGFIRGDKSERAHIGRWGAHQGFVTGLANYRLAPEARWPAGAEDAAAAWHWLQLQAGAHGGRTDSIVLAGESAGAAHVAAATLVRAFQKPGARAAGAFLLSGPYDARLERMARDALGIPTPDPRNDAYFGSEREDWTEASIIERIDAPPLPVAIAVAERDLPQMQVQAGALFARLVTAHGYQPQFHVLREHNHFSPGFSLGTEDDSLAAPLAAFVQTCAAHAQA